MGGAAVLLSTLLFASSCARKPAVDQSAAPSIAKTEAPAARATPQPGGRTSPRGELLRAQMENALRGLLFDSGVAVVDPAAAAEIVDGPNADAAQADSLAADVAEENGHRVEAVSLRVRAILYAPESAAGFQSLGRTLHWVRFTEQAAASYRAAIQRDDSLIESRYELGICCQQLTQLDAAISAWNDLIARHPDYCDAHRRLAGIAIAKRGRAYGRRSRSDAECRRTSGICSPLDRRNRFWSSERC